MNLESVFLKGSSYEQYLQGVEVDSILSTRNKNIQPGQHVMVYRDMITASPLISVPADRESESIGVEGKVVKVDHVTDLKKGSVEQHLRICKL